MIGVHMLHGGEYTTSLQLHDGALHLPAPVRREGADPDRWVGLSLLQFRLSHKARIELNKLGWKPTAGRPRPFIRLEDAFLGW